MKIETDQQWWTRIQVVKTSLQAMPYGPKVAAASSFGDSLEISDQAQSRIDGLKSAENSLKDALRRSRSQIRSNAADRIKAAKDYLLMLASMSSPNDPHAAKEAARVAKEIKDLVKDYGAALTGDRNEDPNTSPAMKTEELKALMQFTTEATGAIELARMIVIRYQRSKKAASPGDNSLTNELDSTSEAIRNLQKV